MRAALVVGAAALAAGAELEQVRVQPGLKGRCQPQVVEGEFLVRMRDGVTETAHQTLGDKLKAVRSFKIGSGFRALHTKLDQTQLKDVLSHPDVKYVTHNMVAHIADEALPHVNVTRPRACPDTQHEPLSWGQKRTTAVSPADVEDSYSHDSRWGAGVDVYVLDTGIRITHEEFEGTRAKWGANFAGGADQDNNGHGTHCAGTIAGKTYGVAKAATVIGVKVLGDSGSGSFAGIISGIEYAVNAAKSSGRRGIGSMSLGGGRNAALNDAVNAAATEGMLFSNAAGNCGSNACNVSPASAEDGICVGSTELSNSGGNQIDSRSSFSNTGNCVDVFAPGSSIVAAYRGSDSAYATLSGTSMAAPHVSGVGAIVLQDHPAYTPKQVSERIVATAMDGLINNPGTGSPNRMLHVPC